MTNRKYIHTLTDEELLAFVMTHPWGEYAWDRQFDIDEDYNPGLSYYRAAVEWLDMEREE